MSIRTRHCRTGSPGTLVRLVLLALGVTGIGAGKEFEPVTRAHLAETVRIRFEALDREFMGGAWRGQGSAGQARTLAVTALHAALQSRLNGDPKATDVLGRIMVHAQAELWDGHVMVNGHEYLGNAIWASLVGAALLHARAEVDPACRETMISTVRGSAELLRDRATGYAPTNVFVSNQDAWAASGLLRAYQCLDDSRYKDAARSKFLAILARQQQGLWSENGVGPLYQEVGLSPFSEVAAALFDELDYRQRRSVMEVAMIPCVLHTSADVGGYKCGLEAARASGFRGPAALGSYCLDLALRQRNPFLLRGVLELYHNGCRSVTWNWGLRDPVMAHFVYGLFRGGDISAEDVDSWRVSWGATARIVALKDVAVCDEQSYIRSPTGLVVNFADRRLAGMSGNRTRYDPGGLRYIARAHEVVVAPDTLSCPRFLFGDREPGEADRVGSRMRRGVYASQYELIQRVHSRLDGPAGDIRQTFCAVDDWLFCRTRSRSSATEYALTHPDSEDTTVAEGRAVLSSFRQSVSGKTPQAHACFALDGMAISTRDSDLPPFPDTAVKTPLDEWVVSFQNTQTRYFAVQANAQAGGLSELVGSLRPASAINGTPPDPRDTGSPYAVVLDTTVGDCYVVFANHASAGEMMTVTFPEHEFRLVDTDRRAISVFSFNRNGHMTGFAASARGLFVDGKEVFRAPGTAYVSCTWPDGLRGYASSDCGPVDLYFPPGPRRSLVTGEALEGPRLRDGEIAECSSLTPRP